MIKYIILGLTQGATEFFPVSSSAHLVLMQRFLGINTEQVGLSIVLHLGTCLALVLFFLKDIVQLLRSRSLRAFILVVTVITGLIGIAGKDFFETLFASLGLIAIALLVTGILLILAEKIRQPKTDNPNIKDAVILGITQAIAIVPGISRSGITISTLLFRGIDKQTSFRISFLASIPAVLGAAALEFGKVDFAFRPEPFNFLVGFLASLVSGIVSLALLRVIMLRAKLHYFGYYCILLGMAIIMFKLWHIVT